MIPHSDATDKVPSLLDMALHYAARGWHVFPCHTPTRDGCSCRRDCGRIGKHPRTKNGLKDATTVEATIRRWWKIWPQANIGLATGAVSGLVVLDEDSYKGGDTSREELEHTYQPLPETVQQLTGGGGVQFFFMHPGTHVKNGVETLGAGLDIRGDGGYVIVPPSLHASGKHYAWELSHHPDEMVLTPMPAWLLALCQDTTRREAVSAGEPIPEHHRNDTLFRLGCAMRARGFSAAVILAALRTMNTTQCQPPLGDDEVTTVAASCAKYEAGQTREDAHQRRNGQTPGPEPLDPHACPELPTSARVDESWAAGASIFLDDYIAFSTKWAPRAYAGFHEAAALFALSTTAARRIHMQLGPHGVYTSLYLAFAARTSIFTKTTVADIAIELLRRAGLQYLLADDDATPQAFLRSLTLYIPENYAELASEAQQAIRERLAFAGQKGWFYEEWGQHLHAMMQKEGQMSAFRSILRRLDDHKDEYVYSSISRGRDVLVKPYVSLLANVTPADLKPFIRARSPLWRDGYIARFAFIAPGDTPASTAAFPEGEITYPRPLITTLANWHKRLGIPRITLEPILDEKNKATGRYRPVFTQPHKETTYVLSPEVRKAFYAYDEAIHTLMGQTSNEDLDGSYARFPMKALRIAGLLASLHDDGSKGTIWPAQWYRGQQIAERWRHDLHALMKQVEEQDTTTREGKGEQRILAVLRQRGALSIRDIQRWTKLAHTDILHHLEVLQQAEVVQESDTGRTKKYDYVVHREVDHA